MAAGRGAGDQRTVGADWFFSPAANWAAPSLRDDKPETSRLTACGWAKAAAGPARGRTPTSVSQVLSPGDIIYADPLIAKGWQSGRGPVPPAPAPGSLRRHGGDGSMDRPRAGDGRRILVRPEPVQPRDAGLSASRARHSSRWCIRRPWITDIPRQPLWSTRRSKSTRGRAPACGVRRTIRPANITGRRRCATRCSAR